MKYRKKITLEEIGDLAKALGTASRGINNAEREAIKEIANNIKETIASTYALNEDEEMPNISVEETGDGARVVLRGSQVVYHEYGTGSVGRKNPHPNKPSSLKPYNSGKYIRMNRSKRSRATVVGGIPVRALFWTYKKNGITKYTQGVASGKEVYYATKEARRKAKNILKQKVGEELSKL